MNLRELQYLVAVDEHRHFHKAAAACFVSQPTLSGQLKKLEQELGVQLVERNTRQVVMSAAGREVADQARLILAEVKMLKEIAQQHANPLAGSLHIGLIPTIGPYLLPHVMAALRRALPELKIWLHEYQTAVLLERLRQGELDVLVLALPVETGDLVVHDLYREPFRLAVERNDPLSRQAAVTLGDIQDANLLLLEEGHCLRDHVLDVCLAAGAGRKTDFHASSLETLRHMVGEGMGMTLMPELAVPEKVRRNELIRYVPFVEPKPTRRVAMVWRKNSHRQQAFEAVANTIRESLPVRVYF